MLNETAARVQDFIRAKAGSTVMRRRRHNASGRTGVSIGRGLSACVLYLIAAAAVVVAAPSPQDGRRVYVAKCASCHGKEMAGASGPALTGSGFIQLWRGRPGALLRIISSQMPADHPGSLSYADNVAVTNYLIDAAGKNQSDPIGIPAGADVSSLPGATQDFAATPDTGPDDAELLHPAPGDWLLYNRDYQGQRYAAPAQITPANAASLVVKCKFSTGESGSFQASPIIRGGIIYITTAHRTYAVDGATCRKKWSVLYSGTGMELLPSNRGIALYRGMVVRGTLDGHLIALGAADGRLVWDERVCNPRRGCFISAAPVAFGGKLFVGEAGADFQNVGQVHAFDALTGRPIWSFKTVRTPDKPGDDGWGGSGDTLGGGSLWSTISVDPRLGRLYMSIGNPGQDFSGQNRQGDNLYTDSLLVLRADTGALEWFAQQNRHDVHDWDSAAAPVIYDQDGRHLLALGSKDARVYLYDRDTHGLIARVALTRRLNDTTPPQPGRKLRVCPGNLGGVEWNGPAYDPANRLLFVNTVDWCATYNTDPAKSAPYGGSTTLDAVTAARGALLALDAATGRKRWVYKANSPMLSGVTPTASGVLLTGSGNGHMLAFESKTGRQLYDFDTGGAIAGGISTYMIGGRQLVAVASGNSSKALWQTSGVATLVVFGLP